MTAHRSVLLVVHRARRSYRDRTARRKSASEHNSHALPAEAVDRGSLIWLLTAAPRGVEIEVVDARYAADARELVLVLGKTAPFCGQLTARQRQHSGVGRQSGPHRLFWPRPRRRQSTRVLEHVVAQDCGRPLDSDVVVRQGGRIVNRWALNEVSLKKGPRLGAVGWSWKLTVGRCRRLAATGVLRPRRPDQPPMHSRRRPGAVARLKRSWWSSNDAHAPFGRADGHQPQLLTRLPK